MMINILQFRVVKKVDFKYSYLRFFKHTIKYELEIVQMLY